MTQTELAAAIRRMAREAATRLADAELLKGHLDTESDSGYLLELLAFEILLMAVARVNGKRPKFNHSYREIFEKLPTEVRDRILANAQQRMTTSADYSDLPRLLETFSANFVQLRYPYQKYEGMSTEAVASLGQDWLAKGAPLSEATFTYWPKELYGLTNALQSEVQSWLSAQQHGSPHSAA